MGKLQQLSGKTTRTPQAAYLEWSISFTHLELLACLATVPEPGGKLKRPAAAAVNRQESRMVKSRLGQSLLRLENSLARIQADQQQAEAALADWRQRWQAHRARLSQRLELIESQLDQHVGEPASDGPQLSLVGTLADEEPIRTTV